MGKLKVFLCHASENKQIVRGLYDRLSSAGFDAWIDSEVLLPGMDWDMELKKRVRSCDAVIICLSTISVAKESYLQKEFKLAQDIQSEKPRGTIFLIPLRLDRCAIPFYLQQIQWVDYSASDGFEKLVKALNIRARQLRKALGEADAAPLSPVSSFAMLPSVRLDTVQLILDGEFEDFDEARQDEISAILAERLNVEKSRIRISKVLPGSVILELELPTSLTNQLISLVKGNDPQLLELRVLGLRLSDGEYISMEATLADIRSLSDQSHQEDLLVASRRILELFKKEFVRTQEIDEVSEFLKKLLDRWPFELDDIRMKAYKQEQIKRVMVLISAYRKISRTGTQQAKMQRKKILTILQSVFRGLEPR